MRSGGQTDVGKVRTINQDSFHIIDNKDVYIVADGMGGHAAGDKASRIAVKTITEIFSNYDFEQELHSESGTKMSLEELLRYALQEANYRIIQVANSDSSLTGMGTTAIIVVPRGSDLFMGHVGDSRVYLMRDNQIKQVTEDHSIVQQLINSGQITEAEAAVHPYKNVITRCLGIQANVEPDTVKLTMQENDRVLMCSDGLSNMVSPEKILEIVMENNEPEDACQKLITLANNNGGTDNITVVLLYNDNQASSSS